MPRLFIPDVITRDPVYTNLRDGDAEHLVSGRKLLESLWERYERHADSNFRTEIQNDFLARFWEMYLTCTLEEVGHSVTCPKPGPDVLVTMGETRVWIEAVAPSGGQPGSPDRVPGYRIGQVTGQPDTQILLRLRSAIQEKFEKYQQYRLNGIVGPNDAYVVAVNASKINYAQFGGWVPDIVRAVYPIGFPQITIDRTNKNVVDQSYSYRDQLEKTSGGPVSVDIFLHDEYRPLSAALYSCANPVTRHEPMGVDFVIVHNFKATTRVPLDLVRRGREYVASEDDEYLNVTVARNWDEGEGTASSEDTDD